MSHILSITLVALADETIGAIFAEILLIKLGNFIGHHASEIMISHHDSIDVFT